MNDKAIDEFSNIIIKSEDVINTIKQYKQMLKCLIDICKSTKTAVISKSTV